MLNELRSFSHEANSGGLISRFVPISSSVELAPSCTRITLSWFHKGILYELLALPLHNYNLKETKSDQDQVKMAPRMVLDQFGMISKFLISAKKYHFRRMNFSKHSY